MTPKELILTAIAFASLSFNYTAGLTDSERSYAVNLLEETRANLLKKVKGLTPEQLNFKADTASWSVAECVEHIALTENSLFSFSQSALTQPADPTKRSEVKLSDDAVVRLITDRTTKSKTKEAFVPTGKFGSFEGSLKAFNAKRDFNVNYVKTTYDDLRNHYNDFPFGKTDAYQTILFMAGHSKRHTDQIEEIMKNPGFPKK